MRIHARDLAGERRLARTSRRQGRIANSILREIRYEADVESHLMKHRSELLVSFEVLRVGIADALGRAIAVSNHDEFTRPTLPNPLNELEHPDVIFAAGSGAAHVQNWRERWETYHANSVEFRSAGGTLRVRTSRGVFAAFCTSLPFGADPASGGAPQLAVIYQEEAALSLGIVWEGQRYFEGAPCTLDDALRLRTRWHDWLFQVCDPETMGPPARAARHGAPARGFDSATSRVHIRSTR